MQLHIDPTVLSVCSLAVAISSLLLSGTVAWFSLVRRGRIQMTRPSLIVFMHDHLATGEVIPKIFLRTLLYSTGNRGHVIQTLYLKLQRAESSQNFSTWGHGPQNELTFGAGLRITPDGIDHNHHFNPPRGTGFEYTAGDYRISIFADLAGSTQHVLLGEVTLAISAEQANQLKSTDTELYFEWGPVSETYSSNIHKRPRLLGPDVLKMLGAGSNDAEPRSKQL